jgi:hypothetical protein
MVIVSSVGVELGRIVRPQGDAMVATLQILRKLVPESPVERRIAQYMTCFSKGIAVIRSR